ncbi:MAG: Mth938-like domain-containing protein [Alphaproteobacteria bacterium]|nr:Mth938-like domain-containing protein [Alphaproteobacteria bacterium]
MQGYAAGGFRVAGASYAGGVLVLPTGVAPWTAGPLAALTADDFAAIGSEIEVVLLGTGATMARPARALSEALTARGVALDFMDSKAAARTYNVLAGEGRKVAAALLPL